MPWYKTAFPGRYFENQDVNTTRPIVTITHVDFAEVGSGADVMRKLVVTFDPDDITFATLASPTDRAVAVEALELKGWVLNRINCSTLEEITQTDDFEAWVGQRIELYTTRVEFQGKRVLGLRCAAPKSKKATGSRPVASVVCLLSTMTTRPKPTWRSRCCLLTRD